jgi:ankyrin repeat protein
MGNAPLHLAAAGGSLACVRLLLDARAEADGRNNVRCDASLARGA